VTAAVSVEVPAPAPAPVSRGTRPARVLLALLALLCAYGALSLLDDPKGTLGTDTGGKLATVATMVHRGTFDPDIGYWAERYDPTGRLHPLWYTSHVGHRWVNVTTLPMVVVARPLYALGGVRAVLILPMLGAALAALAARALARRIGGGNGWWAFWAVGLASPMAVYALDFWEHAPGVALALWGLVFMYDVLDGRAGWRAALASGVLFGAAATMRTEALVYALAVGGVAAVVLLHRTFVSQNQTWMRNLQWGIAYAVGIALPLMANQLLEQTLVGGAIRTDRAAGTAAMAGGGTGLRAREAVTTAVGLNRFAFRADWVFGALIVALVAYAALRFAAIDRRDQRLGAVALAVAAFLYVLRFADGLGFVPGVLTASPLAAAGVAVGWSVRRWRLVGAVALLAVPVVGVFQLTGGANPQWGGRYLLVTGTLLVVGAAVVIPALPRAARAALVALAVLVTASGVLWLSQRSHAVASAMQTIQRSDGSVLVSREAHLLREGGAFYDPDARWLTATSDGDLRRAAAIASDVHAPALRVVGVAGRPFPATIGAWSRDGRQRVEFLPGLDVVVVTYTGG
jgi:hypothetical protein